MQDVLPPAERSIRNVPLPTGRRRFSSVPPEEYVPPVSGGSRRSFGLWAAAVVVASILAGILVSTFFEGATITVHPKTASVTLPPNLQAGKDAPVGALSYQLMTVTAEAKRTLTASGQIQVNRQASGVIVVYNTGGTASQKLIANTRFQAPDGKIYRIRDSITVPGGKKNADGTIAPGTIETTVYADSPGEGYNRGETRFTIPGFKGDPRFDTFYATAASITGGFSGMEPSVTDADLKSAEADMRQELEQSLATDAASKLPEGFLPVQGAFAVRYDDTKSADAGGGKAALSKSATAVAVIIRSSDLANSVAGLTVSDYDDEAVDFTDLAAVSVGLPEGASFSPLGQSLTLSLSGDTMLQWQFDAGALARALAGKEKSSFESIVKTFAPAIDCGAETPCNASIRPFWRSSFPKDAGNITVKAEIE